MRRRKHTLPPKEDLYKHYITENLSIKEIGKLYNVSSSVMNRWLNFYNITKDKEQVKMTIERNRVVGARKKQYMEKKKQELLGTIVAQQEILELVPEAYKNQYGWRVKCLKCGKEYIKKTSYLKRAHFCTLASPNKVNYYYKTAMEFVRDFPLIDIEELKEYTFMDYSLIVDDRGNWGLVSDSDIPKIQEFYWHVNSAGYFEACNKSHKYNQPQHLMLHRFIKETTETKVVIDHINGHKRDNRRENLR